MKKMISFVALAAISTSASAFDYKFNLEGRSDFAHTNTTVKTQGGAEVSGQSNGFLSSLVRLNLMGNINDNLSYRMRYRFNVEGTNTSKDVSSNSLDYLYVDHKNSIFTTRFGKSNWAEAYGRESFISSTDLFLNSAAYSAYNSVIGTYRYGVSATYTLMEAHKFTLAVSNPNANATDGGTSYATGTAVAAATPAVGSSTVNSSNTSVAYAIHYSSIMFDKMFQPTLSYTLAPQDADAQAGTVKADATMMAAGFRTEAMGLIVDADWKQLKREKTTKTGVEEKTSSIFANVAYNINDLSPFVQYVNDKFEGTAASKYKTNSFAAGVMWKPFNDVNFRYHLVYTNINKKFDASATALNAATAKEIKDNRIAFGIKADI